MSQRGHNETPYRLDMLASEARQGLNRVDEGEEASIGGWLAYGLALNEGRSLFTGDREFGEWVRNANLAGRNGKEIDLHDRTAAMWAAANSDQFEEARQRGNPRTIRGIHAKWKEIEVERAEEERRREEGVRSKPDQESSMNHAEQPKSESVVDRKPIPSEPQQDLSVTDELQTVPDPYGYSDLTEEALLETANGLRAEIDDDRKRISSQRSEIADLKAQIKELTSGDTGRTIGNLQRQLAQIKGRAREDQAKAARLQRRCNSQEAELVKLRKSVAGQEIPL